MSPPPSRTERGLRFAGIAPPLKAAPFQHGNSSQRHCFENSLCPTPLPAQRLQEHRADGQGEEACTQVQGVPGVSGEPRRGPKPGEGSVGTGGRAGTSRCGQRSPHSIPRGSQLGTESQVPGGKEGREPTDTLPTRHPPYCTADASWALGHSSDHPRPAGRTPAWRPGAWEAELGASGWQGVTQGLRSPRKPPPLGLPCPDLSYHVVHPGPPARVHTN